MTSNSTPRTSRRMRSALLAGTALALVFGGAVVGGSLDLARVSPAHAEAVQVTGAQPSGFADVVDKVQPAVVSVRVKLQVQNTDDDGSGGLFQFFDFPPGSPLERQFKQLMPRQRPQMQPQAAQGSGFFISGDGFLVTNNHVVDSQKSVSVVLNDGTELPAKVVGTDPRTDIALLKVEPRSGQEFTYVSFAGDRPRVGDWVIAIGNPFGLGGTVTAGIVSAEHRQIGAGPYDDFLQIDAPINHGNSGGPAFNLKGEVVGINTAINSPTGGSVGIAFAIPGTEAARIVNALKENGSVTRGWLGLQIQSVTPELAASLGLSDVKGAIVGDVIKDTPAAKAGFKVGDVVTTVNGDEVTDSRDLSSRIASFAPGTSVKIDFLRGGKPDQTTVVLEKLPAEDQLASNGPMEQDKNAATSTPLLDQLGISLDMSDDGKNVVVTDIDPSGKAAEQGIETGDVVVAVGLGGDKPASPADVEKQVAQAKDSGLKAVMLRLQSGERTKLVGLSFPQS